MDTYQVAQEWNDLLWGVPMPVAVMVGSSFARVRAWGECSVAVTDLLRLAEQMPDPANIPAWVKSVVVSTFTDLIGERGGEVSDVAQLTAVTPEIIQMLQTKLESKFNAIGLRLKNVSIGKIESL